MIKKVKKFISLGTRFSSGWRAASLSPQRDGFRYLLTFGLFIVAFMVPLGVLGFFGKGPLNLVGPAQQAMTEHSYPRLVIRGPDSYLKVTTADPNGHLGPIVGQELLILMWLKLNAIQADDRRAVALLQSQHEQKKPPGFGLAFIKTTEGIRPEVYWKTEQAENSGGWLSFEDLDADLSEPIIIALSVRAGKVLGLHQIQRGAGEKNSVNLLGGAEVGQYGALQGSNSLIIGAPDHSNFRGDVLGLLIQSPKRLPEDLNSYLKTMGFWPKEVVQGVAKEELQLFVDGSGQVGGVAVQPLVYHRAALKDPSKKRAAK